MSNESLDPTETVEDALSPLAHKFGLSDDTIAELAAAAVSAIVAFFRQAQAEMAQIALDQIRADLQSVTTEWTKLKDAQGHERAVSQGIIDQHVATIGVLTDKLDKAQPSIKLAESIIATKSLSDFRTVQAIDGWTSAQ